MWQDLQKADPRLLRSTVRRFMEVTEDLGHAMGEKLEEQDVVVVVTSNICKLQKQRKQNRARRFMRARSIPFRSLPHLQLRKVVYHFFRG